MLESRSRLWAFVSRNRYRRLLVRGCLIGLLGLAVLFSTGRWWLPAVLPQVLARFGVQAESVVIAADGELQVAQVKYVSDGVTVLVDTMALPSWSGYLWER